MNVIGDIKGKTCILVDDIVDTAGSLCGGAKALKEMGAAKVYAACAHAVLTDPAVDRIKNSVISELIITNTIPLPDESTSTRLKCCLSHRFSVKLLCAFSTMFLSAVFSTNKVTLCI